MCAPAPTRRPIRGSGSCSRRGSRPARIRRPGRRPSRRRPSSRWPPPSRNRPPRPRPEYPGWAYRRGRGRVLPFARRSRIGQASRLPIRPPGAPPPCWRPRRLPGLPAPHSAGPSSERQTAAPPTQRLTRHLSGRPEHPLTARLLPGLLPPCPAGSFPKRSTDYTCRPGRRRAHVPQASCTNVSQLTELMSHTS